MNKRLSLALIIEVSQSANIDKFIIPCILFNRCLRVQSLANRPHQVDVLVTHVGLRTMTRTAQTLL